MECEFVVKGEWHTGPYEVVGKLVDIDFALGITIVNATNPDDYLCCLVDPSAPNYHGGWDDNPEAFEASFMDIVRGIKEGKIDFFRMIIEDEALGIRSGEGPTVENCPFGQ